MPKKNRPRRYQFKETLVRALNQSDTVTRKTIEIEKRIPHGSLANWLNLQKPTLPDVEVAFDIAQTLGVSLEYLVTGEHPANHDPTGLVDYCMTIPVDERSKVLTSLRMLRGDDDADSERESHKRESAG